MELRGTCRDDKTVFCTTRLMWYTFSATGKYLASVVKFWGTFSDTRKSTASQRASTQHERLWLHKRLAIGINKAAASERHFALCCPLHLCHIPTFRFHALHTC